MKTFKEFYKEESTLYELETFLAENEDVDFQLVKDCESLVVVSIPKDASDEFFEVVRRKWRKLPGGFRSLVRKTGQVSAIGRCQAKRGWRGASRTRRLRAMKKWRRTPRGRRWQLFMTKRAKNRQQQGN